ncbi:phospholipase, patatin family protein [Aspergillus campestris IBT 28561]|uniref:Phospholipase, patatin family protein n=1 Tax=Aspergillus campestris (strain IBT 28561) TaxID=1392248 RepID=A0A2I1D9A1_ASPC2|nr:phospholipase, patatin family protein [Aspergillus campestris IBT 28561]PKY06436.1 phospholipase, patatin family protein [Aspergillus campestris IBT 28561]
MADRTLSLLSLDGGGIRGLSSLHILKHLMECINPEDPPKPCDYFDMIGGTGSGGLIAIMLGRLKMDIYQCIHAYKRLMQHVFTRKRLSLGTGLGSKAKYDSRRLESALKTILKELGYEKDALLRDADITCRVFVCVTDDSSEKLLSLTSYPSKYSSNELFKSARVWEATQATFAHTALFEPVTIGPSSRKFHDSTKEAGNPIREVWIEAKGVWPSGTLERQLRCMVSIGAGTPSIKRSTGRGSFGMKKKVSGDAANTEAEMNKFIQEHSELDDDGRLFRFDVPNGLADIKQDGVGEISTIVDETQNYLTKELVYKQLRKCGKALRGI